MWSYFYWYLGLFILLGSCSRQPVATYPDLRSCKQILDNNKTLTRKESYELSINLISIYKHNPYEFDSLRRFDIEPKRLINILESENRRIPHRYRIMYELLLSYCYKIVLITDRSYRDEKLLKRYIELIMLLQENDQLSFLERGYLNMNSVIPNYPARHPINVEALEKAIYYFKMADYWFGEYKAHLLLGNILVNSQTTKAIYHLDQAMELYFKFGDSTTYLYQKKLTQHHIFLSHAYYKKGNYEYALNYLQNKEARNDYYYELLWKSGKYDSILNQHHSLQSSPPVFNSKEFSRLLYVARTFELKNDLKKAQSIRKSLLENINLYFEFLNSQKTASVSVIIQTIHMGYMDYINGLCSEKKYREAIDYLQKLLNHYQNAHLVFYKNGMPQFNFNTLRNEFLSRPYYAEKVCNNLNTIFHTYIETLISLKRWDQILLLWEHLTLAGQKIHLWNYTAMTPIKQTDIEKEILRKNIQDIQQHNHMLKRINLYIRMGLVILIVLMIYLYYQYQQKKAQNQLIKEKKKEYERLKEQKQQNKIMTESEKNMHDLFNRLEKIMIHEQLFLNSELRLSDLTPLVYSNKSYVSQAINKCSGYNFNIWINKLRIEYALPLLSENEHTLDQLSITCGFASRSTFYRSFKQYIGLTPQDYIEQERKNKYNVE